MRHSSGFRLDGGRASLRPINHHTGETENMIARLKRVCRVAAAVPAMLALLAGTASAQNYPTRNITLVLPFAAGSGTDTTTRIISKELGTALGVGMIIDNKAGANGSIAASYVARSAPDGYTLFVTTNTTHSANPYL